VELIAPLHIPSELVDVDGSAQPYEVANDIDVLEDLIADIRTHLNRWNFIVLLCEDSR
jgi:hypothetical protein